MTKQILIEVSNTDFKCLVELGNLMKLDELSGKNLRRFSELRRKVESSFYINDIARNAASMDFFAREAN